MGISKNLLFSLIGSLVVVAETNGQVFRNFAEKEGAPNRITSITQDKFGFMWYATESGLTRYDTRIFKNTSRKLSYRTS